MSDIIEISSDSSRPSSPLVPNDALSDIGVLNSPSKSKLGKAPKLSPIVEAQKSRFHDLSESGSDSGDDLLKDLSAFPDDSVFNYVPDIDELLSSQVSSQVCSTQGSQSPQKKRGRKVLTPEEREAVRLEKEKAREEKEKVRDEKRKEKELKAKEKQERQNAALQLRRFRPGECIQYMSITVDERLYKTVLFEKCMEIFPLQDVTFICQELPYENAIKWSRREEDGSKKEEDVVAIMIDADRVAELIQVASLVESMKSVSSLFEGKRIILWIFCLGLYYRKSKNSHYNNLRREETEVSAARAKRKGKEYLTREEMEMGLTELQVLSGISYRSFETFSDLSNLFYQYTKSIAETPFRLKRDQLDNRTAWFSRGESKDCVKVDKDMNGLSRLWARQLAQFNAVGVDTVNAITTLYPTPTSLMQAYEKCSSQKEKEKLLQDIQIIRTSSVSAATRKLGPELSRRICLLFTSTDGSVALSQES